MSVDLAAAPDYGTTMFPSRLPSLVSIVLTALGVLGIPGCAGPGTGQGIPFPDGLDILIPETQQTDDGEAGDDSSQDSDTADTCGCGLSECGYDRCSGASCGSCGAGLLCTAGTCATPATDCDFVGFTVGSQAATLKAGALSIVASDGSGDPPFSKIAMSGAAGSFLDALVLDEQDPNACEPCARAYRFCQEDVCFNRFKAVAGEVFSKASAGTQSVVVERLVMEEMLIEGGRFIVHPDPKRWCVGDIHLEAPVTAVANDDGCVASGTGTALGSKVGDLALTNCLGEMVSSHDFCGEAAAVWLVAVAGWSGASESFVPKAQEIFEQRQPEGLELLVVLGESNTGPPPTLDYCAAYAASHGIDPARVLIDPGFSNLFATVDPGGPAVALPWSALLDGASMRYAFATSVSEEVLHEAMASLLSQ